MAQKSRCCNAETEVIEIDLHDRENKITMPSIIIVCSNCGKEL